MRMVSLTLLFEFTADVACVIPLGVLLAVSMTHA